MDLDDYSVILGNKISCLSKKYILNKIDNWCSVGEKNYIVTPNPEIVLLSVADSKYKEIINNATIAVADGVGLKFGAFILGSKIPPRITGVELMLDICKLAIKKQYKIGLLGSDSQTLVLLKNKLEKLYPNIKIVYAGEGMDKDNFKIDNQDIIDNINESKPDILFVAFGAPKQEMWIAKNYLKLDSVKVSVGVGGSFDYISGKIKRAPVLFQKIGLEWVYRLYKEPWRFKRIYNATFKFLMTIFYWKIRSFFFYRKNVMAFIVKDKKIFLAHSSRFGAGIWLMPQGGCDKKELPKQAIFRELKEEIGTDNFIIKSHLPNFNKYKSPKWARLFHGYKGQSQDLFILEFVGNDNEIVLDNREFNKYNWFNEQEAFKKIEIVRLKVFKKIVNTAKIKKIL